MNDGGKLVVEARKSNAFSAITQGMARERMREKHAKQLQRKQNKYKRHMKKGAKSDAGDEDDLPCSDNDVDETSNHEEKPRDWCNDLKNLEEQLESSRKKHTHLRPRAYKSWKAALKSRPESFKWRSTKMPYSCKLCIDAPFFVYELRGHHE